MGSNRITILATIGAFVLGAVGANAVGDDGPSFGGGRHGGTGGDSRERTEAPAPASVAAAPAPALSGGGSDYGDT